MKKPTETPNRRDKLTEEQAAGYSSVSAIRRVGPTLESDPNYVEPASPTGYSTPETQITAEGGTIVPNLRGTVDESSDPLPDQEPPEAQAEPLKTRLAGDTSSDPHTDLGQNI